MEKGNELAKNGTFGETIRSMMEELEPEAAFFGDTVQDTARVVGTGPGS